MSAFGPLKVQRRISLLLSFACAAVGFAVGVNALVKANQERSYINHLVVIHGIIHIGIHDIFASGAVITVICAFLAILSYVLCALTWHPIKHTTSSFWIQSLALFLCAAWLCATLVIYDYFFATRSAQITVNLHGQRIPEIIVQRLANSVHAYRDVLFLRLLAVLPWFAFLAALIAGVVLRLAAGRADTPFSSTEQGEKHVEP